MNRRSFVQSVTDVGLLSQTGRGSVFAPTTCMENRARMKQSLMR
jgi:hypothetical protein